MQRDEDLKVLSEELDKLDQLFDDLVERFDQCSTRTLSRKLRIVGERFIMLSKAIRRKNFPKYIRENEQKWNDQDNQGRLSINVLKQ